MNHTVFKTAPAVFAVEDTYQIMIPVTCETLMWVKVGEQCFFDHANGTLRSATSVHRMTVPRKLLDEAQEYTVGYRVVKERKPYCPETEEPKEVVFSFQPVGSGFSRGFLVGDAHNDSVATVAAAKQFEAKYGGVDFLILAGDIPNHCGEIENLNTIYEIAGQITGGNKPTIYAKGNHDMRGVFAEKMEEYCPSFQGKSYFTWRIGDIWGISLDCGEDKDDSNFEYGHTICCHQFRLEQTEFIRQVLQKKAYLEDGIRHRIILSHNPFTVAYPEPFNIEEDLYRQWCTMLKAMSPELMISAHIHGLAVLNPGCKDDHLGQPCPLVIGTMPFHDEQGNPHYIGTGFTFTPSGISYVFMDENGREYQVETDIPNWRNYI